MTKSNLASTYNSQGNKSKSYSEVAWLQITSGQGPKECAWVVTQVTKKLVSDGQNNKIKVELVESRAFEKQLRDQKIIEPDAHSSTLLRLEGCKVSQFCQLWIGAIKWHGASPYRPKHKRLNWFVGVEQVGGQSNDKITQKGLERSIKVEAMRASGPGGQHVNKTNSAVRVTHSISGLSVKVDTDRSQHRNRQLAIERLQLLLTESEEENGRQLVRDRWKKHYEVGRGDPIKSFYGVEFSS